MDITEALMDTERGFTSFSVQRTTYRRQNGESVSTAQTLAASGCIHPGTPEMIRLLPEEDRHKEFIAVYYASCFHLPSVIMEHWELGLFAVFN